MRSTLAQFYIFVLTYMLVCLYLPGTTSLDVPGNRPRQMFGLLIVVTTAYKICQILWS